MQWYRCRALILLSAVYAACGDRSADTDAGAPTFTVRDSLGIAITTSTARQWPDGGGWTLAETPSVTIGSSSDGPDALFSVGPIVPLSEGRFALAHRSRHQVLWFDSTGTRLSAAGREGDGPGEFRTISRMFRLPGDTLVVTDGSLARLSIFDAEGQLVRTSSFDFTSGLAQPVVLLSDRTLLARPGFSFNSSTPAGIQRDTAALSRFDLDGKLVGEVPAIPMGENWVFNMGGSTAAGPHPFGKRTLIAPSAGGFWIVTGDRPEAELRGPDGALRRIVRWADRSAPLTQDVAGRFETFVRRDVDPQDEPAIEAYLEDMDYPATLPSASELMTDSDGYLWVEPFDADIGDETSPPWVVLAPDGHLLGVIGFPGRLEIRAITTDRVYGVWTDELDIEWVRVYRLERTADVE